MLKEYPQAFGDGEDGVAMGDIFDDFTVDMLPTSPRRGRRSGKAPRLPVYVSCSVGVYVLPSPTSSAGACRLIRGFRAAGCGKEWG